MRISDWKFRRVLFRSTERIFTELRHSLADITPMSAQRLPWSEVRIDRSNRRWESLCALAKLLIRRDWQATHHTNAAPQGLTLLFPMNDLFEIGRAHV